MSSDRPPPLRSGVESDLADAASWGRHLNLLRAAAENVAGNLRVYGAASVGLVLGLALLLSGIAISEGLKAEALAAVRSGADVFCTWDMFGRDAPVPRSEIDVLRKLGEANGVRRLVPRIIGRVSLGDEFAIVVGVPLEELSKEQIPVEGVMPRSEGELLVGRELARAIGLRAPKRDSLDSNKHDNEKSPTRLTLEGQTVRVFTVSGIVDATSSLWSAKALVMDIDEAASLFGESDHVSDVCLYTRPGYATSVAEAVQRLEPRFRVQTKALVRNYVMHGMTLREGIFTILLALVLALAIPTFAILTYLGATPRRREIGLLKAEGWQTADVLEMVALENAVVSVLSASTALLLAFVWVKALRAPLIAPLFIAELPLFPAMRIPAEFLPLPLVLSLMFSLVVTMTGSIYSTWRTAVTRPAEVMK